MINVLSADDGQSAAITIGKPGSDCIGIGITLRNMSSAGPSMANSFSSYKSTKIILL